MHLKRKQIVVKQIRQIPKGSENLLHRLRDRVIDLKTTTDKFIPLGKLLAHKSLCTQKNYDNDLVRQAFEFFNIDKTTIEGAWKKFPKEEEYDSRLDFFSKKIDKKFHGIFKKIEKDFNFHMKIMSNKELSA